MAYVYWEKRKLRWFAFVEPKESADASRHWLSTGIKEPKERPTVKGEEAANLWLQNHLTEQLKFMAAGIVPTPDRTVKEVCDAYLKSRGKLDAKCRENDIVRVFLRFKVGNSIMGGMSVKAIRKEHIQSYLNEKRQKVTTQEDGTVKTSAASMGNYKRHRATLLAIFEEAKVQPNPVAETVAEDYEDRRHREMTKDEQALLQPFLQDPVHLPGQYRLGRIITFALFSLMRRNEIFRCRWRDIDLAERKEPDGTTSYGKITVVSDVEQQTKGRETRKVDIYPPLRDLLLVLRAEAMKATGANFPTEIRDRHVFLSADGKPYKAIKTVWSGLMKKAGIKDLRFHDLRRTGSMRYYRLGVPLLVLQTMLGHSDPLVTMRYLGLVGQEQTPSLNRAWQREKELQSQEAAAAVAKAN